MSWLCFLYKLLVIGDVQLSESNQMQLCVGKYYENKGRNMYAAANSPRTLPWVTRKVYCQHFALIFNSTIFGVELLLDIRWKSKQDANSFFIVNILQLKAFVGQVGGWWT